MKRADSRAQAAQQRAGLYRLTAAHAGRDAPEACGVCCEAIAPLAATQGEADKLLVLGCAHCFHYRWEGLCGCLWRMCGAAGAPAM
jgi:hypothetical protein